MKEFGSKKNPDAFILAMAMGSSIRDAAAKGSISESTAYRRLNDPEWQDAIKERQEKIAGDANEEIASHLTAAAKKLSELLGHESGNIQLGAARALLDFGLRYRPGGESSTQNVNVAPVKAELDLSKDALAVVKALAIGEGE